MTYKLFTPPQERPAPATDLSPDGNPLEFHQRMPEYQRTPLLDCPALARALGVETVLVKDESERLGLPSFKMLGASWATVRAIQREWLEESGNPPVLENIHAALLSGRGRRLAAATDGNHGRGVARMARLLGLACTIYVPKGTAEARIRDIEVEGATVTVVDGTYDDAIARSAGEAGNDTLVISDTSWEGYTRTPSDVIAGYSTMFEEIDRSLAGDQRRGPDLVCFQAGVGSFAAAGLRHYRPEPGTRTPRTVVVEPTDANCLMRSAEDGHLSEAPGPHTSAMAGLNCGLPSPLAWPVVFHATDNYLAIDDESTYKAMRLLAESGIVAGESGAACLGALLEVAASEEDRRTVGLTRDATVLIINTEGATDPVNYERNVGLTPLTVEKTRTRRRIESGVTVL